jgi:transposase
MAVEDKIQYRRQNVLKLRSKGLSYPEISHKLQYSLSTIEKDIKKLRQEILN